MYVICLHVITSGLLSRVTSKISRQDSLAAVITSDRKLYFHVTADLNNVTADLNNVYIFDLNQNILFYLARS